MTLIMLTVLVVPALLPAAARATTGPTTVGSTTTGSARTGPVVVIGTGGTRWDDVDLDAPTLTGLLSAASIGVLAVRSVHDTTCPVDGWLTLSAGRRAAAPRASGDPDRAGCPAPAVRLDAAPGGSATVTGWSSYLAQAHADPYDAEPGLLGRLLQASTSVVAVGPGAAVAVADGQGRLAHAFVGVDPAAPEPGGGAPDPSVLATDLDEQVRAALALDPDLLVVDAGAVRDPAEQPAGAPRPTGLWTESVTDQVSALDTRLQLVLGELPTGATVIVASLADSGRQPQLQLVAALGPGPAGAHAFAPALLRSDSTRQDGLVQLTDLQPTVLRLLGHPVPADAVGATLVSRSAGEPTSRLQRLLDLQEAAVTMHQVVPSFFAALVLAQLVLYGVTAVVLRRRAGTPTVRHRLRVAVTGAALWFAAVPAGTFLAALAPWWRLGPPLLMVSLLSIAFALPPALLAVLGPGRRLLLAPIGWVGGLSALVLAADVLSGSRLQLCSPMGDQPLVAGRFYGIGNPAFALFASGMLLAAAAAADALLSGIAIRGATAAKPSATKSSTAGTDAAAQAAARRRRLAAGVIATVGLVATLVDGLPGVGSDFGGPPAIVPAFSLFALLVAGVRLTARRLLGICCGTLAAVLALSLLDWLRPADQRTHLGRFVQTVLDGGGGTVVARKTEQNVAVLTASPLNLLLPVVVVLVIAALLRPERFGLAVLRSAYASSATLRPALACLGVLLGIAVLVNDSGTAMPAGAATLVLPLLVAVLLRAADRAETLPPGRPQAARRPPAAPSRPPFSRPWPSRPVGRGPRGRR